MYDIHMPVLAMPTAPASIHDCESDTTQFYLAALHLEVDAIEHLEPPEGLVHLFREHHGTRHQSLGLPRRLVISRAIGVAGSSRAAPRANRRSR